MFPFDLWQCAVLGSCVLIALAILSFGFSLAWGLHNDLRSWGTTILYYGWILWGMYSIFLPPVFLQMALLTGLWLLSLLRPWNSKRWLQWGFLLTVLAWGGGGYLSYQNAEEGLKDLQEEYPLVSLAERIPRLPLSDPKSELTPQTLDFVNDLDGACSALNIPGRDESSDSQALQAIYGRHRWGVLWGGTTFLLRLQLNGWSPRRGQPIPKIKQPEESFQINPTEVMPNPPSQQATNKLRKSLYKSHLNAVIEFVDPPSFGYVRDRDHVAGFDLHRFQWKVPAAPVGWKFTRLELVSLLVHQGPVTYQSEFLPSMVDAANTPTRPLDPWEVLAFKDIAQGEILVLTQFTEGMRMMGAIRNTRHCVQCHGGKPGDLLGAFAYVLTETK